MLQLLKEAPGHDWAWFFDWQPEGEIGLGLSIPLFLERKSQFQHKEAFLGRKLDVSFCWALHWQDKECYNLVSYTNNPVKIDYSHFQNVCDSNCQPSLVPPSPD